MRVAYLYNDEARLTDVLSSKERDTFVNWIKIYHSVEEQKGYCKVFAPHIVPFVDKGHINVAVIGTYQFQNQEVVTWHKIEITDEKILELLNSGTSEKEAAQDSDEDTVLFEDEASYFSEVLHSLADQLPFDGMYNCDIIISSHVLEGKILRDHMYFAAALYRFRIWHNANVSVVRESSDEDIILLDWYEGIDSCVVTPSNVSSRGAVFWRGGLQVGLPDTMKSAYVHGLQLDLQTTTKAQTWSYIMEAACMESLLLTNKGSLIVSSKLEVLDECALSTIPPYVMTPIVFNLSLSPCHNINEQAYQFLQLVKKKPQVAFILRLQYSQTNLPLQKNEKTFEKWKEAAMAGNISIYDPVLPSPKQHLNFVLTGGDCTNIHSAVAYLMRNVDDVKADFFHNLAKSNLPYPGVEVSKSIREQMSKVFSSFPHLNVSLNTFSKVVSETQLKVLQAWRSYKKSEWHEDGAMTLDEIKGIFSKVQCIAYSKFLRRTVPQETESDLGLDNAINESSVDPSDWPERNFLLQKQILASKNKKYNSSDTLGGLAPPVPQETIIAVSAHDVLNHFTSLGEAKNQLSDVIGNILKMKDNIDVWHMRIEEVQHLKWPDVLQSKCHDIYYNHSNYREDLEAKCNRIRERCVVNETASICSNQQLLSNFIVQRSSGDIHSSENHLPLKKPTQGYGRGKKRKYASSEGKYENERHHSEVMNKSLPLDIQLDSVSSLEELQQLYEEQCRNNYNKYLRSKKSDVPLRRSPRKLARVNYKQSPSRNKSGRSEYVKVQAISDDLSEKHKMKLREAVALALEQHGVGLNHPAFKQCGRKLFAICKTFVKDVIGKGSTSSQMRKIAQAHVKQVIEFEMQKGS